MSPWPAATSMRSARQPSTSRSSAHNFALLRGGLFNPPHSIEYNISYVYHAMYAYFDRDNVGLPGFAKYFKDESDEERGHAELLMKYQVWP